MSSKGKILIVEDEITNAVLFKRLLQKNNFEPTVCYNGEEAVALLQENKFDAILTDWMMPKIDGIELIRSVRDHIKPLPYIIMITSLSSESAKHHAIESGADDFVAKPVDVVDLVSRLEDGLKRKSQEIGEVVIKRRSSAPAKPLFPGVVIASSTGGPPVLTHIFKTLNNTNAAYFIVQHGPPWMLETFVSRLQRETSLKVNLGNDGDRIIPGNIYLAPGDQHMTINGRYMKIALDNGPKQNFVRPAADPLFKTASEAFGEYLLGVVLTGLGKDGALGSAQVRSHGGHVVVQDPSECIAPSMPQSVLSLGIDTKMKKMEFMASHISKGIDDLKSKL